MLDRAREFKSKDLHDEKLISLGKLSAGLAHELNNPASAIERAAALLDQRLEEAEHAARALGAARLTDDQLTAVDALRSCCMNARVHGVMSPIQQAEREDAISDWLEAHHLPDDIAGPLAETAVTTRGARPVRKSRQWSAARSGAPLGGCGGVGPHTRFRGSGSGDAHLGAGAVHQGLHRTWIRPPSPSRSTCQSGLSNTVDVLKSKARSKSVAITVTVEPNLPKVSWLHRRAESNLVEFDRQRARRGGSGRARRHHREPRAPARRGAHHR